MQKDGLEAYRKIEKATNSPRQMEARVLTNGALKLSQCLDALDSKECRGLLFEALRFNQRIWTIFQSDLASPENQLPRELRLNLLKLGAFVDRQIFSVMAKPSREDIASIIDINLALAAGLRNKAPKMGDPEMPAPSGGMAVKG